VDAERLADDIASLHARIEGSERVLEDDLHRTSMRPQFGFAEIRNVLAVEPDAAAGRLDQPQHAARHRRFAAAGFADKPERLSTPTEKLTPSTACTVPTLRRRTPPRTA